MVEPNQEDDKKEDSKAEQNMVRIFLFSFFFLNIIKGKGEQFL